MLTQLLFIISLFSSALSYEQVCNHGDQSSLLTFSTTISTSASHPLNWSSLVSCCHWEGVRCNARGRVTHLELPSRSLEGIISSSIGNLDRLTHLNLSANHLHGTLGEGFGRIVSLRIIDLSFNNIHGFIPQGIGNLLRLKELHLDENKLHGFIPSSLMNCSKLEELILRFNLLEGDISKLDFSRLVQLKKLDLANNRFTGTIPESVYSCKSLIAIRVAANNLSGQISPRIIELKSLSYVSLSYNFLTNITTTLQSLARCRNLTTLFLSSNFYGESLPVYMNFIGLDEFPKLQILFLASCKFGGLIPTWLSKLKGLRALSLGGNQMTGKVPDWMGTFPNLVSLDLSSNSFYGEFPLTLCQLPTLISQNTDPYLNFFHLELPMIVLRPDAPSFVAWSSGSPDRMIYLSYNNLSGDIPPEISNLQTIQALLLDNNFFSGHIPVGISSLKNLEELRLDGNNLTGEIPPSLKNLHFLSHFNVSYNDLEGPIPIGGQLDTFDKSSFEGNPRLCGELLNRSCTKASTQNITIDGDDKSHDKMQFFVNGLFVGFAVGFSGVLAIVVSNIWFNRCKQAQNWQPSPYIAN